MKDKDLIHVRFEREEGVQGKKNLLEMQISLLRISGNLKRYHSLRKKELQIKSKLSSLIKRESNNMKKIHASLPQIRIHKELIPKHEVKFREEISESDVGYDSGIESQLREIQEKLNSLNR